MDYLFDHVRLTPDKQIGAHSQPDYELSWIITGSGMLTLGIVTEPFTAGEVFLVPPGLTHCGEFDPDNVDQGGCIENITFHFSRSFIERTASAFPELSGPLSELLSLSEAVRYQGKKREEIINLLTEMDDRNAISRIPTIMSLLSVISDFADAIHVSSLSHLSSAEKRMEKIRVYISCNYRNRITIDEISAYAGMNRTAFCAFFKKETGTTFITYLNEFRIERACELLRSGNYRVSEVATDVGFESLPHFCRTFRRIKGFAPSAI